MVSPRIFLAIPFHPSRIREYMRTCRGNSFATRAERLIGIAHIHTHPCRTCYTRGSVETFLGGGAFALNYRGFVRERESSFETAKRLHAIGALLSIFRYRSSFMLVCIYTIRSVSCIYMLNSAAVYMLTRFHGKRSMPRLLMLGLREAAFVNQVAFVARAFLTLIAVLWNLYLCDCVNSRLITSASIDFIDVFDRQISKLKKKS